MMDEQRGNYLAGLALTSDKEITVTLAVRELWLIVSGLQLTVSHPGLHEPLKTICEQIGRDLGARIMEQLPEVGELLEMGWHREFDYVEYDDQDDVEWEQPEYDEDDLPF